MAFKNPFTFSHVILREIQFQVSIQALSTLLPSMLPPYIIRELAGGLYLIPDLFTQICNLPRASGDS